MNSGEKVIQARGLHKHFKEGGLDVHVLQGVVFRNDFLVRETKLLGHCPEDRAATLDPDDLLVNRVRRMLEELHLALAERLALHCDVDTLDADALLAGKQPAGICQEHEIG